MLLQDKPTKREMTVEMRVFDGAYACLQMNMYHSASSEGYLYCLKEYSTAAEEVNLMQRLQYCKTGRANT